MTQVALSRSQATIDLFDQYVIPNYRRYPIALVRGEGSHVWDADGQRYLDLFPGWGCNILGYSPPAVVKAIQEQAATLIHVPNTWYIEQQGRFAQFLCTRSYAKMDDIDAVRSLVDNETCGIMIEPIQGEGGVRIPEPGFLQALRDLCDEHGLLLMFDEVQTGMGRTGTWFGYQQTGVQPDVITMAKGIAAGVACGAMICRDEFAGDLRPGMHASTFGGNSLAMAAGLATGQTIEREGLLEHVQELAEEVRSQLESLQQRLSIIREVRICGMMIGIDLTIPATPAVAKCMERGVLINATNNTVVRLLPAINISSADLMEGLQTVAEVLEEMATEVQ